MLGSTWSEAFQRGGQVSLAKRQRRLVSSVAHADRGTAGSGESATVAVDRSGADAWGHTGQTCPSDRTARCPRRRARRGRTTAAELHGRRRDGRGQRRHGGSRHRAARGGRGRCISFSVARLVLHRDPAQRRRPELTRPGLLQRLSTTTATGRPSRAAASVATGGPTTKCPAAGMP